MAVYSVILPDVTGSCLVLKVHSGFAGLGGLWDLIAVVGKCRLVFRFGTHPPTVSGDPRHIMKSNSFRAWCESL